MDHLAFVWHDYFCLYLITLLSNSCLESASLLSRMTSYRFVFRGKTSLTLLYLSIDQDAQEQHGDNQIGIGQQLHKEGM